MALLVDLDERTWTEYLERIERWHVTATLLQATFRTMLEDTVDEVREPHIRAWLGDLLVAARRHEALINELYLAFSRDRLPPSPAPAVLLARMREVIAEVEQPAGGARGGGWRQLRELALTNLDSTMGFAVIEQLGLALGLPVVVDLVQPVIKEKTQHQLVLRECVLEAAPKAILYRGDV